MLRSTPQLVAWCAADPGSMLPGMGPGSAAHHFVLRRVRDTRPRYLTKHIPIRVAWPMTWQASPSAQVHDLKLGSLSAALACWM